MTDPAFWPVTYTPLPDVADSPTTRADIAFLQWWLRQVEPGCVYRVVDNGDGTYTHRWDAPDA